QKGCSEEIMTVTKDIRLDHDIFAYRPFDRMAASVDFRCHSFDNDPMSSIHSRHPRRHPPSDRDSHEFRLGSAIPGDLQETPHLTHRICRPQTHHDSRCATFRPVQIFSAVIVVPESLLRCSGRLTQFQWPVPT